jgi:o-succinylbenzoate synthase
MRVESYSIPLAEPLVTAAGEITERRGMVTSLDGGIGDAAPLPGWTESLEECEQALERAVEVAANSDPEAALETLDADRTPAARHGLALAIADARARRAETPLYRWLGGGDCERVPVNATIGDVDRETTVERTEDAVAAGFDAIKLKVGARPVTEDVGRLEAVRAAVGPEPELRGDANGAWTLEQAREAFEAFERLGVAYVEQPLAADALAGHARLRAETDVGVALDESVVTAGIDTVLAAAAADVVVVKPMTLGGPALARSAALRARDADVTPVVTTTVDSVVARTAALHVAASLPNVPACGLATAEYLASDLATDPAPVSDGTMAVPQTSGHGVEGVEVS